MASAVTLIKRTGRNKAGRRAMTDFEKIMMVTKRAKEAGIRASVIGNPKYDFKQNIFRLFKGIADTWFDQEWVCSLFPEPRERILALKWYNTVFTMRLKSNGVE